MKLRVFFSSFFLIWCCPFLIEAKTVYINSFDPDIHKIFYDPYHDPFDQNKKVLNPYYLFREGLEKAGYTVKYTFTGDDMTDFFAVISWNQIHPHFLGSIARFPKERCFLFNFEPHVMWPDLYDPILTHYFGKIFVMFDDLVDNKNYFKFYFPQPSQHMLDNIPTYDEKRCCTLINTNKFSPVNHPKELFSERLKVINFFEALQSDDFFLFGNGWNGYRTWQGSFTWSWPLKWHVLKNFRFVFCYENMNDQKGYITEKIFDAFCAGCIPIYWGATNITDYVPKTCFIDRRNFANEFEIYEFIKTIDEKVYNEYLQEIKHYLASPQANLYSVETFIKIVLDELSKL